MLLLTFTKLFLTSEKTQKAEVAILENEMSLSISGSIIIFIFGQPHCQGAFK